MAVSFANDIRPLFREIDVEHMQAYGMPLDSYSWMSDPGNNYRNAQDVLNSLITQSMPPGGPFWTQDMLDRFSQWMKDGYQP